MASALEIRAITVAELPEFAAGAAADARAGGIAPISISRARAHALNPLASETDTALLAAYVDNGCVGYLGFLRGILRVDSERHPMLWLSTWYVPPEHRATGAGAALILRAFSLREDIAVTGVSDEAAAVYRQMRFSELAPLEHLVVNMRRAFVPALPVRAVRKLWRKATNPESGFWDSSVDLADRLSAKLVYPFVLRQTAAALAPFNVERVDQIDEAAYTAGGDRFGTYFERPLAFINWMLANPWVVTDPAKATPNYYFRDVHRIFEYVPIVLRERAGGRPAGFAILRLDDIFGRRSVTVFDHNLRAAREAEALGAVALRFAATIGADEVVLPVDCRDWLAASGLTGRLTESRERSYFAHAARRDSPLAQALDSVDLGLADGDLAFA